MIRTLSTLATALALCATTTARAAPARTCLEADEVRGLVGYFLPEVLTEVSRNCSAHLRPDSYVRAGMPRLIAELTAHKPEAWPMARAAFFKLAEPKDAKTMAALPDETLHPIVDAMMTQKISIPVTPSSCADVNDVSEALAPLSGDETVQLVATILSTVARKDAKMPACPREPRP
jgi:hypothetical protein